MDGRGEKMVLMVLTNNDINRRDIGQHVPKLENRQSGCWRVASAKPVCVPALPEEPGTQASSADGVEGGKRR